MSENRRPQGGGGWRTLYVAKN